MCWGPLTISYVTRESIFACKKGKFSTMNQKKLIEFLAPIIDYTFHLMSNKIKQFIMYLLLLQKKKKLDLMIILFRILKYNHFYNYTGKINRRGKEELIIKKKC